MRLDCNTIHKIARVKLVALVLLTATAVTAFASLGDGVKGKGKKKSLLSNHTSVIPSGSLSLRSGYMSSANARRSQPGSYIMINTTVTYQKGNTTYIVPLKKKVLVSNVSFRLGVKNLSK